VNFRLEGLSWWVLRHSEYGGRFVVTLSGGFEWKFEDGEHLVSLRISRGKFSLSALIEWRFGRDTV
jgi:hypothetical protein